MTLAFSTPSSSCKNKPAHQHNFLPGSLAKLAAELSRQPHWSRIVALLACTQKGYKSSPSVHCANACMHGQGQVCDNQRHTCTPMYGQIHIHTNTYTHTNTHARTYTPTHTLKVTQCVMQVFSCRSQNTNYYHHYSRHSQQG